MIGERLKKIRKEKGLTLKELAELIPSSPGFISEVENGLKTPGGDFILSLKRIFDVDLNWLLTGEEGLAPPISTRAAALVDNFEALSEEDKRAIERTTFALAECGEKVKKKAG